MRYYFLEEDFKALRNLVAELSQRVVDLGKAQGEAAGQSTENMGHDDAVQETIEMDRRMIAARINELNTLIQHAQVVKDTSNDEGIIRIGAKVVLSNGMTIRVGSFSSFAPGKVQAVSYNSPLGKQLIGKKQGDTIVLNGKEVMITEVTW